MMGGIVTLRVRDERGQIMPLVLGLSAILVMAVLVVVNASNAFLERRALVSWADGAASAAVQEIDVAPLYRGEVPEVLPVSQARAHDAVSAYLARNAADSAFDGFRLDQVEVTGDGEVTVQLAATVPLVLDAGLADAVTDGVGIDASASAVAELR